MSKDIPPVSPVRRRLCGTAAATLAAAPFGALLLPERTAAMGQSAQTTGAGASTDIRPFHYKASDTDLADLKRRIKATRWPEKETVDDDSQGVQLATMQKLAQYWGDTYDWRKVESRLAALPQFMTNIDGLDIHFIHVRSKQDNALPVIITHGWPGSIIEQMKLIDPLTNPTAHGGTAADAFHVVIPSMPGYGFSERPSKTGWGPKKMASAWIELMQRLGYEKYVAQGGDWGSFVTEYMGAEAPPGLLGIHVNLPSVVPPDISKILATGAPPPAGLSPDEQEAFDRLRFVYAKGVAYGYQMGLRPQTLYGQADSPIGLAAYFLDHDQRSYRLISRVFDGKTEGLTKDDVLDNVTIAWLTNTFVSGGRLYWEFKEPFFDIKGSKVPTALTVFPDELYPAPRSWSEKAYSKLVYYNHAPKGGHFAAWEQPQILTEEMRKAFRPLRA